MKHCYETTKIAHLFVMTKPLARFILNAAYNFQFRIRKQCNRCRRFLFVVFFNGLPEFDAISLGIEDVYKLADALIVLDFVDDGNSLQTQLLD